MVRQPCLEKSLLVLIPILLAGCQQSGYELVPVSGQVTFDGGSCPHTGTVTFQPVEIAEELPKRPATGKFNVGDGKYEVSTFSDKKGVLPGRYLVKVSCFAGPPDFSKPDPWNAVNYIAADYEPSEIVIEQGSKPMRYDIDVPQNKNMSR